MPQKEPSLEDRLAHFIQSRVGPLPRDAAHILAKEFMLCSVPVLQEYVTTTYEENVFIGGNNGRT